MYSQNLRAMTGWLAIVAVLATLAVTAGTANAAVGSRVILVANLDGRSYTGTAEYMATQRFRAFTATIRLKAEVTDPPSHAIVCVQRGQQMAILCSVGCDPFGTFRVKLDTRRLVPVGPQRFVGLPALRQGDTVIFVDPRSKAPLCSGVLHIPPVGLLPPQDQ